MRWRWLDRFVEFERGRWAVAEKKVGFAGCEVDGSVSGLRGLPHSLVLEGLAQAGGLLLSELNEFRENIVLAKVAKARFYAWAPPGVTLTYRVTLHDVKPEGAFASGTSHIGDRLQAEAELFFALVDKLTARGDILRPDVYARIVRSLKIYEVGRDSAGQPLQFPLHLLQAEAAAGYCYEGALGRVEFPRYDDSLCREPAGATQSVTSLSRDA